VSRASSETPGYGGRSDRKAKLGSKSAARPTDYQFVQYTPTTEDKLAIKSWNYDPTQCLDSLLVLLEDGYKLSLSFKSEDSTFTASLTCNDVASPNHKRILTGRGREATAAIRWIAWLHYIRFEGTWLANEEASWDY